MGSSHIRTRSWAPLMAWMFGVILVSGCTSVTLISDYDQETDKALTALQQKADDFIESLKGAAGTDQAAFSKHQAIYEELDRDLRRIEFRVSAIPKNSHTIRLVADIRKSLLGEGLCSTDGTSLKDLHCIPDSLARGPSKASLAIAQRNVNQTISVALQLEVAKKQGLEKNDQ